MVTRLIKVREKWRERMAHRTWADATVTQLQKMTYLLWRDIVASLKKCENNCHATGSAKYHT